MARGTPIITAFTGGETTPLTDGRVDSEGYHFACATLKNMIVNIQGPAEKCPGTRFIREVKASSDFTRLIEFQYAAGDNYVLELGNYYMRFFTQGGIVMSGGSPYEIATPWQSIDLDLVKFVQSADVMYFVHPLYPPRKLTRLAPTSWSLAAVDFIRGPFLDANDTATTVTPSATTGSITLTSSAALFNAGHVGALWKLIGDYAITGAIAAAAQTVGVMTLYAGEKMIVSLSGTWTGTVTLERSFDAGATWLAYIAYTANATAEIANLEDGVRYRLNATAWTSGACTGRLAQKDRAGYVKITSYSSQTVAGATVLEPLASTAATAKWAEGAFSAFRGYPTAIAFYEQRLLLAGTGHRPSTIWGSYVDDYESHESGATDAHAYAYTLAGGKVNRIIWMVGHKVLFVGTVGDEWKFGFADEPTTNTNVDAKKETEHGSAPIQPLPIEGAVVFAEAGGRALRAIAYNLDEDGYRSPRISDHAEHLLQTGIVGMALQQQPTPIIWMFLNSGEMVACTFSRAYRIAAFSRRILGGAVESVAVSRANDRDEVWVIVKRTVNGTARRYIERFDTSRWELLEDAFYVDSGLSYDGPPAAALAGLDHLEGETVNILADGAVHPPRVVTGGVISLDGEYSKVHAGLPYQALLKTKRIEFRTQSGTSQGKPKQIFNVAVRLHRSLNCLVGYDEAKLLPIFFRTTKTPLGEPPALFSGDKKLPMIDRGTDDGHVVVANSDPVPFTVMAIIPTMYASEL
jgi:hypothetical protein